MSSQPCLSYVNYEEKIYEFIFFFPNNKFRKVNIVLSSAEVLKYTNNPTANKIKIELVYAVTCDLMKKRGQLTRTNYLILLTQKYMK